MGLAFRGLGLLGLGELHRDPIIRTLQQRGLSHQGSTVAGLVAF